MKDTIKKEKPKTVKVKYTGHRKDVVAPFRGIPIHFTTGKVTPVSRDHAEALLKQTEFEEA